MPQQTAAIVAHFGERAYPIACARESLAERAGTRDVSLSWTRIAEGSAALPRTLSPTGPVMPEASDGNQDPIDLMAIRQLLYVSTACRRFDEDDLAAILRSSRDYNVLYSVTGILWSDGDRFIQVLEGPIASVGETYDRIIADKRHHSLMIIYDTLVAKRDFGSWLMCHRLSYETEDEYDQKIRRALADIPNPVHSTLQTFISKERPDTSEPRLDT